MSSFALINDKLLSGLSWSGHERNHLFLSNRGKKFYDLAGICGLDHAGDSRSFGILDFDRDGWPDIALANVNTPQVQLYRNQIGKRGDGHVKGNILAVRFVGGNHTVEKSGSWSNRDGIGAQATVILDSLTIKREYRAGEGLAAQNSATMIVGMGKAEKAAAIKIRWPSGNIQEINNVAAGTLVTVYENPEHSPTSQGFILESYKISPNEKRNESYIAGKYSQKKLSLAKQNNPANNPKLRLYTTMATWCGSCKKELPQLKKVSDLFDSNTIAMFGVPIDKNDSPAKLNAYVKKYQPAYELLTHLSTEDIATVETIVKEQLKQDGLPATIITDNDGYILRTMWGVPSVSEIRELLGDTL